MRYGFTRLLLLLLFCLPSGVHADDAGRLHDLFDREWAFRVSENPLLATSVGRHEYDDRLPVIGSVDQRRRGETWRGFLAELRRMDRAELSVGDRVNYDIFEQQLEVLVAEIEFRSYEIPLNADSGFHMSFARLPVNVPLRTAADFENYLSRLRAFPKYMD